MTALHPNPQVTAEAVPPAVRRRPARRRVGETVWDGTPHGATQLGAMIVAVAVGLFAVQLALHGFGWAALPCAVLTIGIVVGALLPDVLARRWDRLNAEAAELGR